mgnify:CR=1 FL=1
MLGEWWWHGFVNDNKCIVKSFEFEKEPNVYHLKIFKCVEFHMNLMLTRLYRHNSLFISSCVLFCWWLQRISIAWPEMSKVWQITGHRYSLLNYTYQNRNSYLLNQVLTCFIRFIVNPILVYSVASIQKVKVICCMLRTFSRFEKTTLITYRFSKGNQTIWWAFCYSV